MAFYFPNSNSLLLLVPKTGSVWIREALKRGDAYHIFIGPPELRSHGYLSLFGREFSEIAAFVRNPIDWHLSYWAYRSGLNSNWDPRWNIDADCASESFDEYVNKVTNIYPGFVAGLFQKFTGPADRPIDYIGKQEQLVENLLELMDRWGERLSVTSVRNLARLNTTKGEIVVSESAREKIYVSERVAFERYRYPRLTI